MQTAPWSSALAAGLFAACEWQLEVWAGASFVYGACAWLYVPNQVQQVSSKADRVTVRMVCALAWELHVQWLHGNTSEETLYRLQYQTGNNYWCRRLTKLAVRILGFPTAKHSALHSVAPVCALVDTRQKSGRS